MSVYRVTRPPRRIRKAKLDNLALVPASLLPVKEQWQEVANSKDRKHILIVLPKMENRPRSVLERVAAQLREKGHAVTTISAERFGQPAEEDTRVAPVQPPRLSITRRKKAISRSTW